jgi:CRP/FNR family transcriptional regulator, cyclic AMP receptor protein
MRNILIDKKTIIPKLKSTRMFNFLSDSELEYLFTIGEIFEFVNKEIIINEGEISPYLYIILSGSVTIEIKKKNQAASKGVYICSIGTGDVIGEAAIFTNFKRTANAIANENLKMFKIERDKFFEFIKTFPGAGIKILMVIIHSLLNKLREVNHELAFEREAHLEQKDIDEIINSFLKK